MADGAGKMGFTRASSAGLFGKIGRLLWFILLCFILFILGLVKGICPTARSNIDFFSLIWMYRVPSPDYFLIQAMISPAIGLV